LQSTTHCAIDVQDGRQALALSSPLSFHGSVVGDVLVHLADDPHRLADRGLLPVPADQVADGVERRLARRRARLVDGLSSGGRDLAEVLGDQVGRAVDQVAPAGDQLVVGARTNSAQVKSVSWFSGPAAAMK
jgi:hypothetical protein